MDLHLGRAAAHQYDRAVTRLLQAPEHHDRDQASHVQTVGRGIEADVGCDDARECTLVKPGGVGLLMDIAALDEGAQKVGFQFNHGARVGPVCGVGQTLRTDRIFSLVCRVHH